MHPFRTSRNMKVYQAGKTHALFLNFLKASLRSSAGVGVRVDIWAVMGVCAPDQGGKGAAASPQHAKGTLHSWLVAGNV